MYILCAVALIALGMFLQAAFPGLVPSLMTEKKEEPVHTTPTPSPQPTPVPAVPQLITNGSLSQQLAITAPVPGATVSQKFTITGKAPGPWYFEASFPIIVSDKDGNKIATGYGQAQGDWMTTSLVPFSAQIDVGAYTGPVTINLLRDNPSGLPENDDSASFELVIQ